MISRLWDKIIRYHHRLERIPDIEDDEVDRLLRQGYLDQIALQSALDNSNQGPAIPAILRIARTTNLDHKRVAELLGASLEQSSEPLTGGWLSKHWPDLFMVASILIILMLPVLGGMADAARKEDANQTEQQPHAIAMRDLVPYVPLEPSDLQSKNTKSSAEASKLIAGLTNRYPTQLIKAGTTVEAANLSKNTAKLTHFSVLRVSLKFKPALEGVFLPSFADLLLSARNSPQAGAVVSVELLNLDTDGLTATVAVPDERVSDVAKWIGNSDAYLLFRSR